MRPLSSLTSFSHSVTSTASGAGRGVAVLAAAGGLVATIALPASAAPEAAPATVPTAVTTSVDSAFGTAVPAVVSAPAAATVVTTAATFTAVPTPAPVVVVPAVTVKAVTVESATAAVPAVTVKRKARGATAAPKVQAVTPDAPAPAAEPAAVATVAQVQAPAGGLGTRILDTASQYAGVPYVYGGTTPAGFDCSGFTGYVMRQVGVSLPRTANAQKSASTPISRSQAVPGDLVFFSSGGRAYHVGIYAGGNQMWDAPRSGKPVQLRSIWSSAVTFGRVAPVA